MRPCLRATLAAALLLPARAVSAAPCDPADAGRLRYSSAAMDYCDGSNWKTAKGPLVGPCAAEDAGKAAYTAGEYRFCDGAGSFSMKGPLVGPCAGEPAGRLIYASASRKMQFCDGTNWYELGNPCPAGYLPIPDVPGRCGRILTVYSYNQNNTGACGVNLTGLARCGAYDQAFVNWLQSACGYYNFQEHGKCLDGYDCPEDNSCAYGTICRGKTWPESPPGAARCVPHPSRTMETTIQPSGAPGLTGVSCACY